MRNIIQNIDSTGITIGLLVIFVATIIITINVLYTNNPNKNDEDNYWDPWG
jgi:hypothetical protein